LVDVLARCDAGGGHGYLHDELVELDVALLQGELGELLQQRRELGGAQPVD
jgi:hypothetical protein